MFGAKPKTSQISLEIFLVLSNSLGVYHSQVEVVVLEQGGELLQNQISELGVTQRGHFSDKYTRN